MDCTEKLTDNILYDCTDIASKGLDGGKAVLINIDDLDRTATVSDGATITNLALKSGTTGYSAEWFKDLGSVNSAYAPSTEDIDGFTHNFLCRIATSSADNAERARELAQGRFIVVVETRYKGTSNTEAFKVMGFVNGLRLSEMTWNTMENSGSQVYTATTEDGYYEPYPYNVYLNTDYDTTKADFDSLFAAV